MKTHLFLHMGPGFHSEVEKKLFGLSYPYVDFWSRPAVSTFEEAVAIAVQKVDQMFLQNQQQPISLIAHSFGGTIARMILQRVPEKIKELKLLNSAFDPFESFISLSMQLLHHDSVKAYHRDLLSLRSSPVQEKINFIIAVASTPEFPELYWHSKSAMYRFADLYSSFPSLNVQVFINIFSHFLSQQAQLELAGKGWPGKVLFYVSTDDFLFANPVHDAEVWKKHFPNTEVVLLKESGHYSHIEDPGLASRLFSN